MIPWLSRDVITSPKVLRAFMEDSREFFSTAVVYKAVREEPVLVEEATVVKAAETVSLGLRAM